MKRLAPLAALLCAACAHKPIPWTGGMPPSGAGLSNDQRLAQYDRFMPKLLSTDAITIHEGTKDVRYTYETYLPVLQSLDPTVEARILDAQSNATWMIICAGLGGGFAAYAAAKDIDRPHRYGAIGLAGLAYVGQRFFLNGMADDHENALRTIRDRLDKKLFP